MLPINTALLKLSKRAETYEKAHLIESFVDIGSLFTLLKNLDNQILFGRRGTGKTHVLAYLANEINTNGLVAIELDMRTIGSTGGIYSDVKLSTSERATRLLVDTLCAIHEKILDAVVQNSESFDLSKVGPLLDNFIDASTQVTVEGSYRSEESKEKSDLKKSNLGIDIGANTISLEQNNALENSTNESSKQIREGTERVRIHFGTVRSSLESVVKALPKSQLWIILDEWSELPLDLQPILADLLRRSVIPIKGISFKIAAIEQRCRFRIQDSEVGHIGIEIGADAAASINLDEFLVFDNNPEQAKAFFSDLLYKHVSSAYKESSGSDYPINSAQFINETFTQNNAFEEFVRSAEGIPRDAINIISIAAQKALDNKISVPDIRNAARTWYTRAKQQAVSTNPKSQDLLNWIISQVIQHRQAKAFLLGTEVDDELIEFLYDARVLHLIKQGVSAQDLPGRRFNVYSLDYGCYVDLINTSSAPKGLFEAETMDSYGFVDVPQTDFRSIRRSILDINAFYNQ